MNLVHNVNQMMVTASEAMLAGDFDTIETLRATVNNWTQTADEGYAQMVMLNAMMEMMTEFEDAIFEGEEE